MDPAAMRPNWPSLMDTETARAYLGGMAIASFHGLTARGGVAPVDMGFDRTFWRRRDLDDLVQRLPLRTPTKIPHEVDDPAEAALAAVSRRATGRGRISRR